MKKIIIAIAAALVAAAGCSDKGGYTPAPTDAPKYISLSYDTASKIGSNTTNRSIIYQVNGKYVKLSIFENTAVDPEADPGYSIAATAIVEADLKDEQLLDAALIPASAEADSLGAITDLKDSIKVFVKEYADWLANPEDVPSFTPAEALPLKANAGYLLCAGSPEDPVFFGIVVPEFKVEPYEVEEEVPAQTPFGDPTIETVTYETAKATILFRQFDAKGNWK